MQLPEAGEPTAALIYASTCYREPFSVWWFIFRPLKSARLEKTVYEEPSSSHVSSTVVIAYSVIGVIRINEENFCRLWRQSPKVEHNSFSSKVSYSGELEVGELETRRAFLRS